jgi:hypothetical protein
MILFCMIPNNFLKEIKTLIPKIGELIKVRFKSIFLNVVDQKNIPYFWYQNNKQNYH